MEINLNPDLYRALKLLVAAVEQDFGIPLALDEARTVLANTKMLQDIAEIPTSIKEWAERN